MGITVCSLRMHPKPVASHVDVYAKALLKLAQANKIRMTHRLIVLCVQVSGIIAIVKSWGVIQRWLFDYGATMIWRGQYHTWIADWNNWIQSFS